MQSSMRSRVAVMWAMALVLAAYLTCLALHAAGVGPSWDGWFSSVVNNWLGLATDWVPAAVCWMALSRVRFRSLEVLFAATAVTSFALGDTYYMAVEGMTGSVPFPSIGDIAYLAFPLLIMAALVTAVHRHVRGLAGSVWLDSAVGLLGAATVLAVVLRPVLDAALTGPWSMSTVVAVAYPMLDLVLVATVVGITALRGVRVGGRWMLLIVGLLLYAAADVIYALQITEDTYVLGTPLDGAWAIGMALVALWLDGTARPDGPKAMARTSSAIGGTALAVSSVATAAGLGVLVMSSRTPVSTLAVALAAVTLLAGVARTQVTFRQLIQLAGLRRIEASTDALTGLSNRRALYAEGNARLAEGGQRQALLLLDLDKFKEVNDRLGHYVGDQLLVQVGSRLRKHQRGGDLLARLGGDEFAFLIEDVGLSEAVTVACRLRTTLDEAFALEGLALHSSASIGIALFPDDGPDLDTLLRKADIAMYKAKISGNGHHAYSETSDAGDPTWLQTVEELRTALTSDQLVVHYQPKIDLATGEVHSVEALVRWDHPARGLLYPDAFLDMVEQTGLMPTLTRVVLAMALDQVASWRTQGQHLTVAVNLSASSLSDADLPDQVASMLAARGVPPHALELEITEEFLMADRERARSILTRLRDSGVRIAIDDFGTGYNSLSYLRDLPIDELKLDRSFVFPMADDARAAALVASTIALAHSLGLRMVAEGVETNVAYDELARLGCDQAQGYFMSRPVPAAELDYWLLNRRAESKGTEVPKSHLSATSG